MATQVRSYSKINLGLAIGPARADGYHSLQTLYQTLRLHDLVTVAARPARQTLLRITSNNPHVPGDARNTAWKMTEAALRRLGMTAEVAIHIQKNLPVQGGMGAGSANAAATLIGLERELGLDLPDSDRLEIAAAVGSDVPLFLLGGSVLGSDRGQTVRSVEDVTLAGQCELPCVVALPGIGVSTPAAFREWDAKVMANGLHRTLFRDTITELGRTYSSVFLHQQPLSEGANDQFGASGILPDPSSAPQYPQNSPEKLHGLSREQRHTHPEVEDTSGIRNDLAENSLLALVRTGIENDFETVVFPQHPLLRDIKRHLMGTPGEEHSALYAALSGSGSALFGLYRTEGDAEAAQHRLQQHGVRGLVTSTMPRARYWAEMFAE